METKPLLYGLIGFFIGGLLVATVAATSDKPEQTGSTMSMEEMAAGLEGKTGDEYDRAFIATMITHHEGAIEMAKLSEKNAQHEEIKNLSADIIAAQEKEIDKMKQWQIDWGYQPMLMDH
jgi:uncharacterized protein (DUF305 family)